MFVRLFNTRFHTSLWSDSRLVDKQNIFCLCTKCLKENEERNIECPTHKTFMRMTRILNIAGPVFACPYFIEDTSLPDLKESLYEPSQEDVESLRQEQRYTFQKDWETQKKVWGINNLELGGDSKA